MTLDDVQGKHETRLVWSRVHTRNDESIHSPSVFADLERHRISARQTDDLAEYARVTFAARAGIA